MERCPVCNARFKGMDPCRRCGTELGRLLEVEAAAERAARRAVHLLAAGRTAEALAAARTAAALHATPFHRALARFAAGSVAGLAETRFWPTVVEKPWMAFSANW